MQRLPVLLRWLVVASQIATVLITWELWSARVWPPLLPALPLPQFSVGWLMILSALAVLVRPREGLIVHVLVVGVAMLMDQTRMQPEIVSHCFLMLGTLPIAASQLIGRMHLVSLWLFSGLHKLLSPMFFDDIAPFLWQGVFPSASPTWSTAFGLTITSAEVALGLLSLFVRTRRVAAIAAVPFHLGILLSLSPLGLDWNEAVWPWNVALAGAGMGLIYPWREPLLTSFTGIRLPMRVAAAAVLLSPLLFYVGVLDAYMAHCLYSGNTPRGIWEHDGIDDNLTMITINSLRVPLPPTERTYWQFFLAAGHPGDRLVIEDFRSWARWWRYDRQEFDYPIVEPRAK